MLKLHIPETELFDEETSEFITIREQELVLEHSLVSIAKWESKWHKPYLVEEPAKTNEEILDYIKCMTINNVNPNVYMALNNYHISQIKDYIENPMTATTFAFRNKDGTTQSRKEILTAEVIYYYMVALQIPFECEKWHIARLMTLIKVCDIKNTPPKKMSQSQIMKRNAALNAARKSKLGSKG